MDTAVRPFLSMLVSSVVMTCVVAVLLLFRDPGVLGDLLAVLGTLFVGWVGAYSLIGIPLHRLLCRRGRHGVAQYLGVGAATGAVLSVLLQVVSLLDSVSPNLARLAFASGVGALAAVVFRGVWRTGVVRTEAPD